MRIAGTLCKSAGRSDSIQKKSLLMLLFGILKVQAIYFDSLRIIVGWINMELSKSWQFFLGIACGGAAVGSRATAWGRILRSR